MTELISHNDAAVKPNDSAVHPAVTDAQHLSQSVFADPQSFLATLKNNFDKIDVDGNGILSKAELYTFAKTGSDATTRAAAQITYNHFDQLNDFENGYKYNGASNNDWSGPDKSDLSTDQKLVSGDSNVVAIERTAGHAAYAAAFAIGTAAMGVVTVIGAEDVPVAALTGGMGLMAGGLTAAYGYSAASDYKLTSLRASQETQAISSWIHGK